MKKPIISITPKGVEINFVLPYELAQTVLKTAPSFIKELERSLKVADKEISNNKPLQAFKSIDTSQADQWDKLSRHVDRERRKTGEKLSVTVSRLSKELHIPSSTLMAVVTVFTKKRRDKVDVRNKNYILRLYLSGMSKKDILKKTSSYMSKKKVLELLNKNNDLAENFRELRAKSHSFVQSKDNNKTVQATDNIEFSNEIVKELRTNNLERHKRLSIVLYRSLRKALPLNQSDRYQLVKSLGEPFGFTADYTNYLIGFRRKKVENYVKKRCISAIIRLRKENKTYKNIGNILHIHEKTVAALARPIKSLPKGRASL